MSSDYIHGFSDEEQNRLYEQAKILEPHVFPYVDFSLNSSILELGCGVGAQTEILLRRFPTCRFTSVDRSERQLERARLKFSNNAQRARVNFELGDAKALHFSDGLFDGAFLCWVLEHISNPEQVLQEARRVLKPGARIVSIEVINNSLVLYPAMQVYQKYWNAMNSSQQQMGGDPHIGMRLGNLLHQAGFTNIRMRPHVFSFDQRDRVRFLEFVNYWQKLSLSSAPQMIDLGEISVGDLENVNREFEILKLSKDASFFYVCMIAEACA